MNIELDGSSHHISKFRSVAPWIAFAAATLLPAAYAGPGNDEKTAAGKAPGGFVEMRQVQAAFIGSGNTGDGALAYRGRSYPFAVSGLGVGGIGVSTIKVRGEVYGLQDPQQFPGTYTPNHYGSPLAVRAPAISG